MADHAFYILDVFAEEKYSGNQLAVVRDSSSLSDTEMQKIAREINFSETTFILSNEEKEGGFDVRIFTPSEEIPFAGHPVLGTAYILKNVVSRKNPEEIILNLKAGRIPVSWESGSSSGGVMWMKQLPPEFGPVIDRKLMADVFGLSPHSLDPRFPAQEVSTGFPFAIAPLKDIDSLAGINLDMKSYERLILETGLRAVLAFCPEAGNPENDMRVRVFVPAFGILEDPATGSGNGCLAGYLLHHGYFKSDSIDLRVEQGYEMGRPSILYLKGQRSGDEINISIGGRVILVAEGKLV